MLVSLPGVMQRIVSGLLQCRTQSEHVLMKMQQYWQQLTQPLSTILLSPIAAAILAHPVYLADLHHTCASR